LLIALRSVGRAEVRHEALRDPPQLHSSDIGTVLGQQPVGAQLATEFSVRSSILPHLPPHLRVDHKPVIVTEVTPTAEG
jgi:hypothetical protein